MAAHPSRREFMGVVPLGLGAAVLAGAGVRAEAAAEEPSGEPWAGYPRQDAELVREVVGASHRDEARVRELVELRPALVNAWWDWGFGDWESPLGAAAHTGRRSIAEFLLERGARLDLFAAAMLGYVEAVKAMVAASPGVQRTLGPHGIPLLAHARVGGEAAAAVVEYLEALGDADRPIGALELTDEQRSVYAGTYSFGPGAEDRFEVAAAKGRLTITRSGRAARLHSRGEHEFYPAGVPSVSVRFDVRDGAGVGLTITEDRPVLTALRV